LLGVLGAVVAAAVYVLVVAPARERPGLSPPPPLPLEHVPPTLARGKRHPMLLVLAPGGDPRPHVHLLVEAADRLGWIVVGEPSFRNGLSNDVWMPKAVETIERAKARLPVDGDRVYATGMSGGAMGSYWLLYAHPGLVRGVIANTGMMPFASAAPFDDPAPSDFPRDRPVAMLASPTDVHYSVMQSNRETLDSLGCRTKWLEFEGGHALAPAALHAQAMEWLEPPASR
jgi:predicted esterase